MSIIHLNTETSFFKGMSTWLSLCRAIEAFAKAADLLVSYNAVERLEPQ